MEDNSDKTGHIRNQGKAYLPTNSWISQYKMGGGYFPPYDSFAPRRMNNGGGPGPGPGDGKINPPIYTNDPNDPRLRAYGDTTRANQSTQLLLNAIKQYNKNPTEKNKKAYYKAQDENYAPVSGFTASSNRNDIPNSKMHKVKYIGPSSAPFTSQNAPDGNPDYYFIYPKAVQPVIYREPTLKPKPFVPATKIPMGQPSTGMQIQQREMPNLNISPVQLGKYKVDYFDPSEEDGVQGGWHTKSFMTSTDADEYMKQRNTDNKAYGPSMTQRVQYKNGGGLLSRTVTCSNCGWSWKAVDGGKDPMTCHHCGGIIKMEQGGMYQYGAGGSPEPCPPGYAYDGESDKCIKLPEGVPQPGTTNPPINGNQPMPVIPSVPGAGSISGGIPNTNNGFHGGFNLKGTNYGFNYGLDTAPDMRSDLIHRAGISFPNLFNAGKNKGGLDIKGMYAPNQKWSGNLTAGIPLSANSASRLSINGGLGQNMAPSAGMMTASTGAKPLNWNAAVGYKGRLGKKGPELSIDASYNRAYGGDISIPDLEPWTAKYNEGGMVPEFREGGKNGRKKKKPQAASSGYTDLKKTYNLDPFSKEGIEKARELSRTNPQTRIVCDASGCSEIAVNAADAYGYDFKRSNAWDLGNRNDVVATNPAYANMIGKGILPDPTNYSAPANMFNAGNIVGLNRINKAVGGKAKNRAEANDSFDYANQTIYPNSRGYEHVGFMLDDKSMLHGTGAGAGHPAYYVIDNDMSNGAQLTGYGSYQPVESMEEPSFMSKVGRFLGFENGGTNWLSSYADGGYTVKKGDTLSGISKSTGVPLATLAKLNSIKDIDKIGVNQVLQLPGAATARPTSARPQSPMSRIVIPGTQQRSMRPVQQPVQQSVPQTGSPFGVYAPNQPVQGTWPYAPQQSKPAVKQTAKPAVKQVVVQTPQGPIMKEVIVDDRNWAQKMYQSEDGHIHKFQLPEDVYNAYQTNLPTNKGKKFGVVSKQNATGYFFDENGNLAVQDEVGIGEQMGDTPNTFYQNKTTPTGTYKLERPNYSKEVLDKKRKGYDANNFFLVKNPDGSNVVGKPEGYNKDVDPSLAFHGIPTHLLKQRGQLFNDGNIDNNCMSAGCINARRQLLDNPYFNDLTSASLYVTPRTSPVPKAKKKKKMGGEPCYECGGMYAEGGEEGGPGWGDAAWTAAQIADPTGVLSYGDAYRGWRDMVQNPSLGNFGMALLNTAAALPVVGKVAKAGVVAQKAAKGWKELNALQKAGRVATNIGKGVNTVAKPIVNTKVGKVINHGIINPIRTIDKSVGIGAGVGATTAKLLGNSSKVAKYVAPMTTAINRGVRWEKLMTPVAEGAVNGIANVLNYAQGPYAPQQKYGGQTNWLNNYK